MNTEYLKLRLTDVGETSMTFLEWRTLMNGTNGDSNMQLIDNAIKKLSNEKADSFRFQDGKLQLMCGETPIGEAIKLDLNDYIKYEFVTELPDDPIEGKNYYLHAGATKEGVPLYTAHQYKNGNWIQVGGAGSGSLDEDALGETLKAYYTKTEIDGLMETVPSADDVKNNKDDIGDIKDQLAAVGVSIQSVEDEDGTIRQYLVSSTGEKLGDAIVGGGGGGGGGSEASSSITVTMGKNPTSVEYGKPCVIGFNWTSIYPDGESTGNGTVTFSVKSGTITTVCATRTLAQAPIGANPITFDFGAYLKAGANIIIIQIKDSEGNVASRRATVTAQVLGLEIDYDWTTINTGDAAIRWRVSGSTGVTFHATVANAPVATVNNPTVGRWQTLNVPHRDHGTYRLRLWTSLDMDDGSTITSSITGFDILFADEGNEKVLIASDFSTEEPLQQYTAQTVRYFVYNPLAEATDVTRLVDDAVYAEDTAVERVLQEWKWKPTESGRHNIGIRAGIDDNQTTRNFIVTINGVDIPESVKEVGVYGMKFSPVGHQNTDADPLAGICKNSNGEEIPCSVNDGFDWVNGGIQYDALGNAYFCIMSGDRLTIDYAPFATDCKPTGRHIKICFNTTEVANRSTPWLSCLDSAENGNAVGLVMTPTATTITSEQNQSLTTRYMYNREKYFDLPEIEMDINIQKSSQERLIQYWMEGCPAQVVQYTSDDGFAQNKASKLVIGSDECEVHLYLMKIADNSWEDEEITDDWIMNAPSGEEMVARYQRNDVYAMDGTIDFDALPEKLIKVIISAEQWTTGKSSSNYIYGTVDFYIDNRHGTADCRFKGQGTSSMGYIGGGLNIDIDLRSEVTWDDGTTSVGIKISENSIPITYMNFKVNIASSESYKNMLYASDYQTFQPYTRPARQNNPNVRDSMEFRMALLCFRNTSEEAVWAGNTQYSPGVVSLYAIGNLGNSKKNLVALGEGVTEEYIDTECLIECTENTTVYQLMHEPVPDDDSITFPDENTAFEFRYPDGEGTDLMKANFRRMERWVASTCTEPEYVTGEELPEMYYVPNGRVTYRLNSNGEAMTVYDDQSRPRKVVLNCGFDTETIEVDGEYYTVLPLNEEGREVTGFSHDTEAYRLGKFLNEFDDYFIFDSIAYHYHVTHQFTMIDNRAKNTFYGTEDGQHWHLVFAYDGDTQMGNNNSGDLTLDYGLEDTDTLGGGYVFNGARHTLWVNIRKLYDKNSPYFDSAWYNRMQSVYQRAETAGAWNPIRRLRLIQNWVNMVPEVLWRDDARKKYMNPLLNGDDASYLSKCNGNCVDQVAQFAVENQPYFASMWQTSANREALVTMRGYTPTEYPAGYTPSSAITLTAFSKCYLTVDYDGDLQKPVRLNPGESATFTQGSVRLNDTPVYIPGAQLISEMSPVSRLYPGFCNFNYLENCQRLEVGEGGSYRNHNLTELAVGGCRKLRYLDARNTVNLTGNLDVSNSRELRTVLAQGSGLSGASFAPGGRLEEYRGGQSVASIVARNLKNVSTFDLESYSKVSRINIESSPTIDTLGIVNRSANVARIRLTDINWNLTGTDLLHRIYGLRGLDATGNDTDRAVLTGQCYVERARESELEMFRSAWPLLEISCGEAIAEHKVTYQNEDGETLRVEVYAHGEPWVDPVEAKLMEKPVKQGTAETEYKFAGWNKRPNLIEEDVTLTATFEEVQIVYVTYRQPDETEIYKRRYAYGALYVDPVVAGEIDAPTRESTVESTYVFTGWDNTPTYVTEDIVIYATYKRTDRWYTVKWYSYGRVLLDTKTVKAHAAAVYGGTTNITRPSVDDTQFLWLGEWDQDTTDVVSDMNLYPVFLRCELPAVRDIPSGYYVYSDDNNDNSVYSKEEFIAILLSDQCKQYLAVGNRIKMKPETNVISDGSIVFSLHAFNHYKLSDGSGTFARTTWYAVGYLNTTRQMNTTNTNEGGWDRSNLRRWLNETLFPTLPLFWRSVIKQVEIRASAGLQTANILTSNDYLYVMSRAEAGGGTDISPYKDEIDPNAENMTFALYTNDASRVKYNFNGEGGTASAWWLRSPSAAGGAGFCAVHTAGGIGSNYFATSSGGVVPGFSI